MSKEWSILFEVSSGCHMIDEPLTNISENAERLRESDVVSVDDETVHTSKVSDRLSCWYVSRSIEIPSFIQSIGSCMGLMEVKIRTLIIPSFIEDIDGLHGHISIEK
jgi:hypothetical protein